MSFYPTFTSISWWKDNDLWIHNVTSHVPSPTKPLIVRVYSHWESPPQSCPELALLFDCLK